jgi:hypothetical protein
MILEIEDSIQKLIAECGMELPKDYLNFLRQYGTLEGELSVQPFWFRVWAADEVRQANCDYQVQGLLPGWFAFGSSGGGELFAFETRTHQPWKVFMIPFSVMDESESMIVAEDFESFVKAITWVQ